MARRRTTNNSGYRRPQWMVFVTLGIALVNAIVRVVKLFTSRRKTSAPTVSSTPAPPRGRDVSSKPIPAVVPPRKSNQPGRGVVRPTATPIDTSVGSDGGIPDLFRREVSDQIVQAAGLIVKVLPDDTDASDGSEQHQKFLVELLDAKRTTIKICHNLKFGRVPAKEGQIVSFRGEYEFNDKGGSVHWTHHDPRGTHDDGWIEIDGKRYG